MRQNSSWELSALLRRECGLSKSHMRTVRAPSVSELVAAGILPALAGLMTMFGLQSAMAFIWLGRFLASAPELQSALAAFRLRA